jgi:predicted nucleic acid-binding protein
VFLQTLPNTLTHAQVTDSYLATVAIFNQGILATLDRDLSRTYDKYSVLVAP